MKAEIAHLVIATKAKQKGTGDYTVQHREFRLNPNEQRVTDGENETWMLLGHTGNVAIESNEGFYRIDGSQNTEDVHVHEGVFYITNLDEDVNFVEFLQVTWVL